MQSFVEWDALANILIFGLLVGAGLPALFAVGVRVIGGPDARDEDGKVVGWRLAVGWLCFGICVVAILGAVAYIAAGGH